MAAPNTIEQLREAFELVLHDARAVLGADAPAVWFPGDDVPAVLDDWLTNPHAPSSTSESECWVYSDTEQGIFGFTRWLSESWSDLVVRVAHEVQDYVFETSQSFPRCPDHPDGEPLWPAIVDDRPVWRCGGGGDSVGPIGQLPSGGFPV